MSGDHDELTVKLTKMQASIVLQAIEQGRAVHPSDAAQIAARIRASVAKDARGKAEGSK